MFPMVLSLSVENADVAELADAQDSKSCGSDIVWVRLPPSALLKRKYVFLFVGLYTTQIGIHIFYISFYLN